MKGLIVSVAMCLVFARAHADPDNVSAALEKIRDDHDVPALAAAVMDEGKLVAFGATGMRSAGRKWARETPPRPKRKTAARTSAGIAT